jgi:hypothetical protein
MRLVLLTIGFYLFGLLIFGCGNLNDNNKKEIPGPQGPKGDPGSVGDTGSEGPQGIPGKIGPTGDTGSTGASGAPGAIGDVGDRGPSGTSCTVIRNQGGALITCGDTQSVLLDGVDGIDGTDTEFSDYEVVALVDPCGPQSQFDEVFLQLANGDLIAHYSDGNGTNRREFLTLIDPGFSYVTTDGTHCYFSVDNNGVIYDEHN